MDKQLKTMITLLLLLLLPGVIYAQVGPPMFYETPLNELKTEFRPMFPDPLGYNLYPNIFAMPPVVQPSAPKVKVQPRIAVFDTITMVEKVIGGKKVWVRYYPKGGSGVLVGELWDKEKWELEIINLLKKKKWNEEDKRKVLKFHRIILGKIKNTNKTILKAISDYNEKLKKKERWKKDPRQFSPPTFNFQGANNSLRLSKNNLRRFLKYFLKIEHRLGKHKGNVNKIQLFWNWKDLIVKVGKLVYRWHKKGLEIIKNVAVAAIKFGAGVVYAVVKTGLEPLLIAADLFRFIFGAKEAWSFTGQLAVHIGKVGFKQGAIDMAKGIITLPVEMAKAFYEGKYFALGEMTGYLIAGKMKLPIKFVPKAGKIIVKFAKESIEKLKKFIKEKGSKLSKSAKRALQKKLAFLEKNPVLAVLHSIEEVLKKWMTEKMKVFVRKKGLNPDTRIHRKSWKKISRHLQKVAKEKGTRIKVIPPKGKTFAGKTRGEIIGDIEGLIKDETKIKGFRKWVAEETAQNIVYELPNKTEIILVRFPKDKLLKARTVADEYAHALRLLRKEKQTPHGKNTVEYYDQHVENYRNFGKKGEWGKFFSESERVIMDAVADAMESLRESFLQELKKMK